MKPLARPGSLVNGRYDYASQLSLLSEVCVGFHFVVIVGFGGGGWSVWSSICFALSERIKGFCDFCL